MIAALLALEAFIQEHGRCGELESGSRMIASG